MADKQYNNGKHFSTEYQPAEKWTEQKSLALGNEMIGWLKETENFLFEEFLVIVKGLYPELPAYLCKKYPSFLKLYAIAKETQKLKIIKGGITDAFNANMSKFVLAANHGMAERQVIEQTNTNDTTIKLSTEQIKDLTKDLDDAL